MPFGVPPGPKTAITIRRTCLSHPSSILIRVHHYTIGLRHPTLRVSSIVTLRSPLSWLCRPWPWWWWVLRPHMGGHDAYFLSPTSSFPPKWARLCTHTHYYEQVMRWAYAAVLLLLVHAKLMTPGVDSEPKCPFLIPSVRWTSFSSQPCTYMRGLAESRRRRHEDPTRFIRERIVCVGFCYGPELNNAMHRRTAGQSKGGRVFLLSSLRRFLTPIKFRSRGIL